MPQMESKPKSKLPALLFIAFAVVVALMFWPKPAPDAPAGPAGDLRITCTFLPMYVFALNVVRDSPGVTVELLVPGNTGCPHSYALSVRDLKQVATSDVIVANGLGLEGFIGEILRQNDKADLIIVSSDCDPLGPREGHHHEHGEGCTHPEHAHETAHEGEEGQAQAVVGESQYNPHVWVSPAQAALQVISMARQLGEIDPARADRYRANAEAYVERLNALLEEMKTTAAGFKNRKIVTFHDAFAYLARDLGLDVVATLAVEPDEDLSANQMAEVIKTIERERVASIFAEPAYSRDVAETIAKDAKVPVFELNPFNDLEGEPTADAYERVMRENLKQLNKALGTTP